ncbi:MAG: malonate decarboxylase acyl carrier protein [Candidatus Marinimicrobia bacterium]|nr:malonate decarboxylase acyl carrier protein [Candidatus Neomarinimicrobiota bacterium]
MEHLEFEFKGSGNRQIDRQATLVGVVSSGNLEVMLENVDLCGLCRINVSTSAQGFTEIWQAVLNDFAARYDLADLQISINDGGSTPAVVCLRLDQAMEEYLEALT